MNFVIKWLKLELKTHRYNTKHQHPKHVAPNACSACIASKSSLVFRQLFSHHTPVILQPETHYLSSRWMRARAKENWRVERRQLQDALHPKGRGVGGEGGGHNAACAACAAGRVCIIHLRENGDDLACVGACLQDVNDTRGHKQQQQHQRLAAAAVAAAAVPASASLKEAMRSLCPACTHPPEQERCGGCKRVKHKCVQMAM
jgi:hypothetical protein